MEYALAALSPHTKEDKRVLEKVERRTIRVTKSLEDLSYEERLLNPELTTRRETSDMKQMHKILKDSDQVTWFAPPALRESRNKNRPQYCSEF